MVAFGIVGVQADMRAKKLVILFGVVDDVGDRLGGDESLPIVADFGEIRPDDLGFESVPSAVAFMLDFIQFIVLKVDMSQLILCRLIIRIVIMIHLSPTSFLLYYSPGVLLLDCRKIQLCD